MSDRRVIGANYHKYINTGVRIIGQIVEKENNRFTIQTTDDKRIIVIMNEKSQIDRIETQWVEVVGQVQDDLSIMEKMTYAVNTEVPLDCQVWNDSILLMEKFNQLF